MLSERIKTFKTKCSIYRRTYATYLVSSTSDISIFMQYISISTVTGVVIIVVIVVVTGVVLVVVVIIVVIIIVIIIHRFQSVRNNSKRMGG